ncbi:19381_t:CDS:2, partial [Dentiscutata erythropus]
DIKKLNYQKANDTLTKSLRSIINDCKDEIRIQEAARLLANKASTTCTSYVTVEFMLGEINCLLVLRMPAWRHELITTMSKHAWDSVVMLGENNCLLFLRMPVRRHANAYSKSTYGSEIDELWVSVEYQRSAQEKLNYEQESSIWAKVENYLENALKKNWRKKIHSSESFFIIQILINVSKNNLGTLGGVVFVGMLCMNKMLNLVKIEESQIGIIGGRDQRRSLNYETTFGNITFDWIESHSTSAKLTKSHTSLGIVKFDVKGIRLFDDKEIWHMEVTGPPSTTIMNHVIGDTKKSLHSDILNLVAILLEHLDVPVKVATNIKVFSLQAIGYRITLYSLNIMDDGSFLASEFASADEVVKQLSIMQEPD